MTHLTGRGGSLTWLGHSTFLVGTPAGQTLLIDPWVDQNPVCPDEFKNLSHLDGMLITHGHFDHIADAVPIANRTKCPVIGIFELCHWLNRQGVTNTNAMNKGGTTNLAGVSITMVGADHSCGILEADGTISYGGEAVGYILRFDNGFSLYHAGDTNVFGDMALIAELYRPNLALLPIGGHFVMGPVEAAKAVELLQVKQVIPMHYGTFPVLAGTPDALAQLVQPLGCTVLTPAIGQTIQFADT